jgi:hypothetical protein
MKDFLENLIFSEEVLIRNFRGWKLRFFVYIFNGILKSVQYFHRNHGLKSVSSPSLSKFVYFFCSSENIKFSRKSIINHIINSEKEFKKVSYTIQNNNFFILLSGYKLSKMRS